MYVLIFYLYLLLNAAYSQSPSMLSKSKSEEKVLEDVNSDTWILPQYFTEDKKEEIEKYVLPENAIFGNTIENSNAPPLIEIIKDKKIIGYAFETYDWVQGLGYSRKPYHIIAGVNLQGIITGVRLMWHTEPIAILGRTDEDLA
jgi:transcriptional regulator of nitric oxide reductase